MIEYLTSGYTSKVLHLPSDSPGRALCGRVSLIRSHAIPTPKYYRECVKCSRAAERGDR